MGTQIEAAPPTLLPDRPKDVSPVLAPAVEVKSAWACSICGAQKTPMRRNHAEYGPKSVCNACGVREARRNKLADKTKGTDASNNGAGHRANAKPYRTQALAAEHDSALQPNRTRPTRKPSARIMESMANADSLDMQPRQRRKLNHENRVHLKQRQSEPSPFDKDGLSMHRGHSRPTSTTGDAFYYHGPPSSAGTPHSYHELSMTGSMDRLGHHHHRAAGPPPAYGAHHSPTSHHLLAPEDREWLYEFNVHVAHGDRRSLSFGSNSDQSSGSEVTAFAAAPSGFAAGDAPRQGIAPVSEMQFCHAVAVLDQCFGGLTPDSVEQSEAAVRTAMAAPGLPDWPLSRHIYLYWRQKCRAGVGQRQAAAPYRPHAFAASDTLGVAAHADVCIGARGDNFSQSKEAVPAKVLASALRRTSSTIDLPQGAKGDKVVQALDDTGILHYRGTQRAYVGTAVHSVISNVNKAASAAFVQPKRQSGDAGWTSDLTIAGPHVLHAQHLDDDTDVHETLLGASLVVSRRDAAVCSVPGDNSRVADAHSVPGECRKRAASADGASDLTPRVDALLNTGAPEMTFIVNDTPVEQRWQQIRERMRASDVARRAHVPLPPSHAPPEASSPRMPSRPPVPPALKPQMTLPPGHMVRVPATSGPDGLPSSTSIEPQYLAMVPRSKISSDLSGQMGRQRGPSVVQHGEAAHANAYPKAAPPPQLSAAAMLRDSLPLRPSSVPPQGTPGTSFAMQCMQHPILRVSMSTVQDGIPPRSAVNSTAGDCS